MNNLSLSAKRKRGQVAILCVAAASMLATGCRKKPNKNRYEILDRSPEKTGQGNKTGGSRQRSRSAGPRSAQVVARPRQGLTRAPELQVMSQGSKPRTQFTGRLPAGLQAVYQTSVRQVTAAPEPIGSFESSFQFRLTQTLLDSAQAHKSADDPAPKKAVQYEPHKKGRPATSPKKPQTNVPSIMGQPLRVTLDQVHVTLPKRFFVNGKLLAKQLEGVSYLASLLPDGSLSNLHVEGPLPKDLTASLERLGRSLNRLQPPIPRLALGKGAAWRVTSLFRVGGHLSLPHTDIQVTMITDYHLDAFEQTPYGRAGKISTTVSVQGKNKSTTVPISATGRGKGSILLLVSPSLVLSHSSQTTIESSVQGKKSSNSTFMKLTLQSLKQPKNKDVRAQTGKNGRHR